MMPRVWHAAHRSELWMATLYLASARSPNRAQQESPLSIPVGMERGWGRDCPPDAAGRSAVGSPVAGAASVRKRATSSASRSAVSARSRTRSCIHDTCAVISSVLAETCCVEALFSSATAEIAQSAVRWRCSLPAIPCRSVAIRACRLSAVPTR